MFYLIRCNGSQVLRIFKGLLLASFTHVAVILYCRECHHKLEAVSPEPPAEERLDPKQRHLRQDT